MCGACELSCPGQLFKLLTIAQVSWVAEQPCLCNRLAVVMENCLHLPMRDVQGVVGVVEMGRAMVAEVVEMVNNLWSILAMWGLPTQ